MTRNIAETILEFKYDFFLHFKPTNIDNNHLFFLNNRPILQFAFFSPNNVRSEDKLQICKPFGGESMDSEVSMSPILNIKLD